MTPQVSHGQPHRLLWDRESLVIRALAYLHLRQPGQSVFNTPFRVFISL